jgi:hypothetical protein
MKCFEQKIPKKIVLINLKEIMGLALEKNHTYTEAEAKIYDPVISSLNDLIKDLEK